MGKLDKAGDHPADTNHAAWLNYPASDLEVLGAQFPFNVKPDHVIIRARAVAINPVDGKMQDHDIFHSTYPTVLGCDVAGEIYDVSETIKNKFFDGERVLGYANPIASRDAEEGAFQEFVSCSAGLVSRIPDTMSFVDACTLPVALTTAAEGLYGNGFLKIPYPSLKPAESGKTVLIWGGSSSVGSAAIQLAAASGMHVIATASPRHHNLCGSLGASACFDYNAKDVDEQIHNMVSERTLVGVFDAIGTPASQVPIFSLLKELGGGLVVTVGESPSNTPGNVLVQPITSPFILQNESEAAAALFSEFLSQALAKGIIKPAPPAHVVGKGLDSIQKAINVVKKGVSGQKIVVSLE